MQIQSEQMNSAYAHRMCKAKGSANPPTMEQTTTNTMLIMRSMLMNLNHVMISFFPASSRHLLHPNLFVLSRFPFPLPISMPKS
jgi:hypothetical protein